MPTDGPIASKPFTHERPFQIREVRLAVPYTRSLMTHTPFAATVVTREGHYLLLGGRCSVPDSRTPGTKARDPQRLEATKHQASRDH
jgi:hypothetical protein